MIWDFIKEKMQLHREQVLFENNCTLTYGQMIHEAENLARTLELGKRYAIMCSVELHTAVSVLACFAAQAIAVPLSNRYGEVHCRRILESIQPEYMLTDQNGEIVCTALNSVCSVQEDLEEVCLILCTSGTTGTPKGTMITQGNIKANLLDIDRYFHISDEDTMLIIRPLYHCAVLTGEFLIGLIKGARICFSARTFDPVEVVLLLEAHQITTMGGTPTLFFHLVNILKRICSPKLSFRKMVISGECMTQRVADQLIERLPQVEKYNVYGLTEASPRVCFLPPEAFEQFPLSVGGPLASVAVKLVDDAGEQVRAGEVGELLVRGPNVMKGYYHDRIATNRVLAGGWLHTGDLAYMDQQGHLFIKGRKDHMIIRGGINIYPQEIENALKQSENIQDVMAYGFADSISSQGIGLKVVPKGGLHKNAVYQICKTYLPEYALPNRIELVNSLPQNASGKLIRTGGARHD